NGVGIRTDGTNTRIGGSTPAERNVISSSTTGNGISINGTTGAVVIGNYIGTDITGTLDRGNGEDGIYVSGDGSIIGTANPGEGNLVMYNSIAGIYFDSADNSQATSNTLGSV